MESRKGHLPCLPVVRHDHSYLEDPTTINQTKESSKCERDGEQHKSLSLGLQNTCIIIIITMIIIIIIVRIVVVGLAGLVVVTL